MNIALDTKDLLKKHNPVLVAFPQDPEHLTRPGAVMPGGGWGDYHPCSVEFFLERAYLQEKRRAYSILALLRLGWKALEPTGIPELKSKVQAVDDPELTAKWELDVAEVPSQDESRAWRTYAKMLSECSDETFPRAVYGRLVTTRREGSEQPVLLLQYWYLYLYNDFRNNHEADWEMVTIELGPNGEPERVGLSSHHSGLQRPWNRVERDGDIPIVHVALGSHAGYFIYKEEGYDVLKLEFVSGLPKPVGAFVAAVKRLPWIRRWRDKPPADPQMNDGANPERIGARKRPDLRILPDDIDNPPDPDRWWWLRYRGRWGSSRPRIAGTVGISTPWRVTSGGPFPDWRWDQPLRWLDECDEDEPQRPRPAWLAGAASGRRNGALRLLP